jgi:hypothetical protein
MDKAKIREIAVKVFKGVASVLILTLAVTLACGLMRSLYDDRILIGVVAGILGYNRMYQLLGHSKGLE